MKKITKAVIPVAGLGTRFLPITKSVPKEMLPIVDKPTLSYIIDECIDSGITDILLITSPYKKVIEDYFDQNYELTKRLEEKEKTEELEYLNTKPTNVNIYFIRQGEPKGSGHAIKLAKTFVGNDYFAVLYGDDIMKSTIPALNVPVFGQVLTEEFTYNFNDLLDNTTIKYIHTIYLVFADVILIFAVIQFGMKVFEEVFVNG